MFIFTLHKLLSCLNHTFLFRDTFFHYFGLPLNLGVLVYLFCCLSFIRPTIIFQICIYEREEGRKWKEFTIF